MIVLDVSAAMNAVHEGENSPALKYLNSHKDKTIAPSFFNIEAAQVAWKYAHAGLVDEKHAAFMLANEVGYVDEFFNDAELASEAFTAAIRFDHSYYDMLYFVLARRTSSPVLTGDHRLAAVCKQGGVDCIELADL